VINRAWPGISKAFLAAVIVGTWIQQDLNAKHPARNLEVIFDMLGLLLHDRL